MTDLDKGAYSDEIVSAFQVLALDLDKGLAAVKIVSHDNDADDGEKAIEPYDCRYPGMKKFPKDGVMLGLWDLGKGVLAEKWVVYAKATSVDECSPASTNEANLAAAKARFAAVGLDLAKPPTALTEDKAGFHLPGGAILAVATATTEDGGDTFYRQQYTIGPAEAPVWSASWGDSPYQRGGCNVTGYADAARLVFLAECSFMGLRAYETSAITFSPVLPLPAAPSAPATP